MHYVQRDNVKTEKDYIPPKKEKKEKKETKKEKDAKKSKKSKTENKSKSNNIRIGLTLPPDVSSLMGAEERAGQRVREEVESRKRERGMEDTLLINY